MRACRREEEVEKPHTGADGEGDEFLMAFAPRVSLVFLVNGVSRLVPPIGIDGAERAGASLGGPTAGRVSVRDADALAALDEGQHVHSPHANGIDRLHPCPSLLALRARR